MKATNKRGPEEACLSCALTVWEGERSAVCPQEMWRGNPGQRVAPAFHSQQYCFLSYQGYTAMVPGRAQCYTVLKDTKGGNPQRGGTCAPWMAGRLHGCPLRAWLAWAVGLTFLCWLHGMEERQGPLTAGRGLGVTTLLSRQVQLGIGERHLRHSVEYL